jgi:TonB family protein
MAGPVGLAVLDGYALLIGVALKGIGVLCAASLVAWCLRRRSAGARHLVWTGAFAALLVLPFLSLSLPALRAPVSPAMRPVAVFFRANVAPVANVAEVGQHPIVLGKQKNVAWLPDWRALLLLLWAAGAVASLAQFLAASAMAMRLLRRARKLNTPELARLRGELGIDYEVQLRETGSGTMPMALGVLRPAVLLPADAIEWTGERRRLVLLHELAHVRRGDIVTNWVSRLALCLHWWNPLAWRAWRELVKERERAADDLVLSTGARASEYAGHLLAIARTMNAPRAIANTVVAMARSSDLEGRLTAVLDSGRRRGCAGRGSAWVAGLVAVAMVAPLAALRGQVIAPSVLPDDINATISAANAERNFEKLDAAAIAAISARKYDVARKLLDASLAVRGEKSGLQSIDYGVGLSNLGDLARSQGHKDAASWYAQAETLLGNRSDAANALAYLGIAAIGDKHYEQALEYLNRAASVESSSHSIALWTAIMRDRQGLTDEADQFYRKAIWQNHGYPNAAAPTTDQELYANFLQRLGREAELQEVTAQIKATQELLRVQATKPVPAGVYRIESGMNPPKLLSKVEPGYTEEARIARYQGTLVLSVEVGTDGLAHNMTVLRGLGLGLDDRALDAVSQWKFQPAVKDGQPIPVIANIEVNFRLL